MAEKHLKVPLIPQKKSMSCWYAAACMVNAYFEHGPRYGIPGEWTNNTGLAFADFDTLAKNENLTYIGSSNHKFTAETLIKALGTYGPILCSGKWKGYGHAVTITGCSTEGAGNGTVYYNDPEPKDQGSTAQISMDDFNANRLLGLMLIRDPATLPKAA